MEDMRRIRAGVRAIYPAAEVIKIMNVEGIHFRIGKNSHIDTVILGTGLTEDEAWIDAFDYVQKLEDSN